MWSCVAVTFEYAQAVFLLIYYWLKALLRLVFVKPGLKDVRNEIILVTGAGLNKTKDAINLFLINVLL